MPEIREKARRCTFFPLTFSDVGLLGTSDWTFTVKVANSRCSALPLLPSFLFLDSLLIKHFPLRFCDYNCRVHVTLASLERFCFYFPKAFFVGGRSFRPL
jgi:hypothetical protein